MRVQKTWGYEQLLFNQEYCQKLLVYEKPIASSLHYHEQKTESFFVASGEFEVELNYEPPVTLKAGGWVHIPRKTLHRVRCIEPGTIVEASTHDDPEDCFRLVPSET